MPGVHIVRYGCPAAGSSLPTSILGAASSRSPRLSFPSLHPLPSNSLQNKKSLLLLLHQIRSLLTLRNFFSSIRNFFSLRPILPTQPSSTSLLFQLPTAIMLFTSVVAALVATAAASSEKRQSGFFDTTITGEDQGVQANDHTHDIVNSALENGPFNKRQSSFLDASANGEHQTVDTKDHTWEVVNSALENGPFNKRQSSFLDAKANGDSQTVDTKDHTWEVVESALKNGPFNKRQSPFYDASTNGETQQASVTDHTHEVIEQILANGPFNKRQSPFYDASTNGETQQASVTDHTHEVIEQILANGPFNKRQDSNLYDLDATVSSGTHDDKTHDDDNMLDNFLPIRAAPEEATPAAADATEYTTMLVTVTHCPSYVTDCPETKTKTHTITVPCSEAARETNHVVTLNSTAPTYVATATPIETGTGAIVPEPSSTAPFVVSAAVSNTGFNAAAVIAGFAAALVFVL
ncbi:hypothetical protein VHEMI03029 [[Torrubiella] hemipterigena]|uniref:Uncharacterized protein n=1 Tax=[Torrubiella] hemipterigena TaxID=1531966 RepID=A0A0A1SRB5_9HYPO|nr:hypothetical protein VHEMI03029 [[Torrubiella] hemipterigena]